MYIFKENQLKYITKEAEDSILKYEQYIVENKENISELNSIPKKEDNIINNKVETDIEVPSETAKNSEEEELEDWLDDI